MSKNIYALLGASGVGKTTIGQFLKQKGFGEIISHTTRPKRLTETEGIEYYFVSPEIFLQIDKIEESTYSGYHYCLSRNEVENKLKSYDNIFSILDLHGSMCLKALFPEYVKIIYIYIPEDEMYRRMKNRGDSEDFIARRIQNSRDSGELNYFKYADYAIENINLDESLAKIYKIVDGE